MKSSNPGYPLAFTAKLATFSTHHSCVIKYNSISLAIDITYNNHHEAHYRPLSFLLTLAMATGSLAAAVDNDGVYVRTDCTFNFGQAGTCMTISACAQQRGKPVSRPLLSCSFP